MSNKFEATKHVSRHLLNTNYSSIVLQFSFLFPHFLFDVSRQLADREVHANFHRHTKTYCINDSSTCRLKANESGDDQTQSKDNQKSEKDPVHRIEISPNEHKLQYAYALWYSQRSPGKQPSIQSYDQNLKLVGRFASVEQFWSLYSHLVRPWELTAPTDFHLFKVGIKPMWEDEANQKGGKWVVRLKKGLASRCWENLILAMLGEQFMVGEEICGAVVSIRFQEDIICVWNKTASDYATTARIRDTLRRVLHLPANASMEYKTHNESLKNVHRL